MNLKILSAFLDETWDTSSGRRILHIVKISMTQSNIEYCVICRSYEEEAGGKAAIKSACQKDF